MVRLLLTIYVSVMNSDFYRLFISGGWRLEWQPNSKRMLRGARLDGQWAHPICKRSHPSLPVVRSVDMRAIIKSAVASLCALGIAAPPAFAQLQPPTHAQPPKSWAGGPVPNEAYRWNHEAVGGGGFITGLSFDASGSTLVARADVYGAYLWDTTNDRWLQLITSATMPSSDRWQGSVPTGAYEVAVAPSDPNRIYIAINGFVYRTDDRGQSLHKTMSASPFPFKWNAEDVSRASGPFMAVDPRNSDVVLLGTPNDGLWRTSDAGAFWQRVSTVPAAQAVTEGNMPPGIKIWYEQPAVGSPTGRIFAMSSGYGMLVSSDNGVSFTKLPSRTAGPSNIRRGTFDRQGHFFGVDDIGQKIWLYDGYNWHDLNAELGLRPAEWAAVAASPAQDLIIALDVGGAGVASSDGGYTWTNVSHSAAAGPNDPPWIGLTNGPFFTTGDLHFDPSAPNRLWIASGQGPFYADVSSGTSQLAWQSLVRGIEELVATDIVQMPGRAPIFAGKDFGFRIKQDTSWPTTFNPYQRFGAVMQLDWSPSAADFVVGVASDYRRCCSDDGNAVMSGYSFDDGQTWVKFGTLPTPAGTNPSDPWRMSFGTIAVSSDNTANIVWAPAYNRQPFYTKDRGQTWYPVVLPGSVGDFYGSFLFDWANRKSLVADKVLPGTFYLYHATEDPNEALAGLWRSIDGGATWKQVYVGKIATNSAMYAKMRAVPGQAGHLFFTSAVPWSADTRLRRSIDGGSTWSIVPGVSSVDDIAFGKAAFGAVYPTIFFSGKYNSVYGIWRSVDNAISWQRIDDFPVASLDAVTVVAADPDAFGRVYIGFGGSGWAWGEPAPCAPAVPQGLTYKTCFAVGD